MLSSNNSTVSDLRQGNKRKRSQASIVSGYSEGSLERQAKFCVREGRWPSHPLADRTANVPDLMTIALHLGLHGICACEVRELGLWAYLKSLEVSHKFARDEAKAVLDRKLEQADMYQHLSFFGKLLPYTAFFNMLDVLRHRTQARENNKRSEAEPAAATPHDEGSSDFCPGTLSELFAEFLEQHAQHSCRPIERRMRCIQLRQALREADTADSYPRILYEHLWNKEQGPWSRFLHERDLEAFWMPL